MFQRARPHEHTCYAPDDATDGYTYRTTGYPHGGPQP